MNEDYRQTRNYKEYSEERTVSARITFLSWVTGLILTGYALSFWYLQVVDFDHYAKLAEDNRIRRVEVSAPRGALLDRDGKILVHNRLSFSVLLDRQKLKDADRVFSILSQALNETPEATAEKYRKAAARRFSYEPIVLAEDVGLGTVGFVEARRAELPGVSVGIEDRRYYEMGASAAHLVGFVGEVSAAELESGRMTGAERGDIVGKAGLEHYFDSRLRGKDGFRQVIVNNVGREMGEVAGGQPPVAGDNVRTSIDLDLQRALEQAFGDRTGAAVFMNPKTGEVLALTSRPGFDPNLFVARVNRATWRALVSDPLHPLEDRALQAAYSPGSTFKLIMTAAALEEGAITPQTVFNCPGKAEFYGRVFSCHEARGHGAVDLHTAIIKSCNIYFYNVGKRLGIDAIAAYARRMGLGRPTGLGFAFEEPGLVPDEDWKKRVTGDRWYPSETISVSIGGGPLLVTPIQQAVVASAFAVDGRPITPTLHLGTGDGVTTAASGRERHGEPLKPETIQAIRYAMWGVVNEWGTGGRAKIPGFDVCGKTGTAQVVGASVGVKNEATLPLEQRDHAWFIGFAPESDPEIAFAVLVEHGGHGAEAAAPIAKAVLDTYLSKRKKQAPASPAKEVALGPSSAPSRGL